MISAKNEQNDVLLWNIFFCSRLGTSFEATQASNQKQIMTKEGDEDKLNKNNSLELQELISQMEEEKKKERIEKATAKKLMRISEVPETEPEEELRRTGRERKANKKYLD